jgi:hypothetical protein
MFGVFNIGTEIETFVDDSPAQSHFHILKAHNDKNPCGR